MEEILIRTEDIRNEDILDLFVETEDDRTIVNFLKGKMSCVLVGSRGVGKSFLFRVAQAELQKDFNTTKVLPIYVSFISSPLLEGLEDKHCNAWMLSKIFAALIRELNKKGISSFPNLKLSGLGNKRQSPEDLFTSLELLLDKLESAWSNPNAEIDSSTVPDAEQLKQAVEEVCEIASINRIVLLIDEASHIFYPRQQRLFFSLFRDLRSPYLNCKAAVYPGVTSYGPNFQPTHDATMLNTERDVRSSNYIASMKEISLKQASSTLTRNIEQYGRNFAVLAYAAHGNPRTLLKSLSKGIKLTAADVNSHIKEYYRTEVWSEHSLLSKKYVGHRPLIDWARVFIENTLLPNLSKKNEGSNDSTTAYFWIHRDAPAFVHQAMGLLKYTGIVQEHMAGVKNGSGEIGTKYIVNLGCLFSLVNDPVTVGFEIASKLNDRSYAEYGKNHIAFQETTNEFASFNENGSDTSVLTDQLSKSINVLDLTEFQKSTLASVKILTIAEILKATDSRIKEAWGIGDVRARQIRNTAYTAVFEYLSG